MTGIKERRLRWAVIILPASCLLFCVLLQALFAGAAEKELLQPAVRDKCPVCGMFVAKYPDWVTAVRFHDGSQVFFDGPKDLFKYLGDMKRYAPVKKMEDIEAIMVKDYYRLSFIDARKARYVIGSDIYGPMGRELIPLEQEADAKAFMNDHRGKNILKFSEVTREVIKSLD